jgi:SAM-dependent methyltransferase
VRLELIGETDADPAYAASVHAAIADARYSSICVRGSVDDSRLGAAYANADLFVLPSRYEGYGIVYAEALALGLPVIACDVGPIPELVGEDAAILVPPGDTETLSGALDLLLRDSTLRLRMSIAARHRAAHLPRWEDTVAGFRRVLQEALVEVRQTGLPPLKKQRSLREEEGKSVANKDLREQNRVSWNAVVRAHDSHRSNLAEFLREGGNTLFPEERALLGDLDGKTLAHLQCNSGSDSLSLAQLRAVVTGVDISDEAVSSARELSSKSGIPAVFVRGDVYDWLAVEARKEPRFDLVYGSYGVICWLPNLETWAEGIAAILRPGGRFVLVDFHPAAMMFDEHWAHTHDYYSGGEPMIEEDGVGDYVAEAGGGLTPAGFVEGVRNFRNPHRCHLFRWGLGEVVTAVAGAGLRITVLEEYPYSNGERHFAGMRELPERRMVPPQSVPTVPLMYGISACKD